MAILSVGLVTLKAMANSTIFLMSFQEKYKRALADTENLRTRSQKMIEDAKLYGNDKYFMLANGCKLAVQYRT